MCRKVLVRFRNSFLETYHPNRGEGATSLVHHCAPITTIERPNYPILGYRRFRCRDCKRSFNEQTGTRFKHLQYPTDMICLIVLWHHRYKAQ
jgi:hypothetical protein